MALGKNDAGGCQVGNATGAELVAGLFGLVQARCVILGWSQNPGRGLILRPPEYSACWRGLHSQNFSQGLASETSHHANLECFSNFARTRTATSADKKFVAFHADRVRSQNLQSISIDGQAGLVPQPGDKRRCDFECERREWCGSADQSPWASTAEISWTTECYLILGSGKTQWSTQLIYEHGRACRRWHWAQWAVSVQQPELTT